MQDTKQFLREFNELWVREDTKAILAAVNGEIWMTDTNGVRKAYAFCDLYRLAGDKVAELTAFVQEIK